jgi:hypothetical protein
MLAIVSFFLVNHLNLWKFGDLRLESNPDCVKIGQPDQEPKVFQAIGFP